jgi:nicotinamidase-related amidase
MNVQLLLIDCQNDFASDNAAYKGSLFVPGADKDMERTAYFINKNGSKIDGINLTMDTHTANQIFHSNFWISPQFEHPKPYTVISVEDVKNGVWQAENPNYHERAFKYVKALARKGRYPLIIWPYHTLEGSVGQALVPCISEAVTEWEIEQLDHAKFFYKGDCIFTERYGALESEVPAPEEDDTLRADLLKICRRCTTLIIAGEALSHCLRASCEQLIDNLGEKFIKKMVLLKDCCSNVPTFEKQGNDFIKDMLERGMKVVTSLEVNK